MSESQTFGKSSQDSWLARKVSRFKMLEGVWEAAAAAEVKPSAWTSKGTSGRKLIRHVVYSFFTGIRRPHLLEFTPRGGVNLSGRAHTSWLFSCTLFTFNHAWFWCYDEIIIWYIAFELWSSEGETCINFKWLQGRYSKLLEKKLTKISSASVWESISCFC